MSKPTSVRRPRIVAMEYHVRGHYADYLRNMASQWHGSDWDAEIEFVVSSRFASIHADADEAIRSLADDRIHLTSITEEEDERARKQGTQHYYGWELFRKYASRSQAAHGLIMYIDPFQLPILLGKKSPCSFSGIYFRPTFHYKRFENWKQRLVNVRKVWVMRCLLRCPQLKELYVVDPLAVSYIQSKFRTNARISHIADTFPPNPSSPERVQQIRRELGIQEGRKVFTLLGVIERRKGPLELLQSVAMLSEEVSSKTTLMLIGYSPEDFALEIQSALEIARQNRNIQIIHVNKFVPGTDAQNYFAASDVILTTYRGHMGSSLALIRAAVERKPLLSTNYGTLGELVDKLRLGVTVDSTNPKSIAEGITRLVSENPFFDIEQAKKFADENSCEQLGRDLKRMLDFCK